MLPLPATTTKAVLVEGDSDAAAIRTLATRRGRDLASGHISIVPVGGASNFARYLEHLGPLGRALPVRGLIDAAEKPLLLRALTRTGFGSTLTDVDLPRLGFFVCDADLEDEMIRAITATSVLEVLEAEDELDSFHTMQRQPAWRDRPLDAQLRRFIGVKAGRKARYGSLLAATVALDRVPAPLEELVSRL